MRWRRTFSPALSRTGWVAGSLGRWVALHALIAASLPELRSEPEPVLERLRYMDEAQGFFVDGLPRLLDEWRGRG
ncbi:MAG: hypothetical protein ABI035_11570 [Gemmatimonadaceae bacterium]